MYIKHKNNYHTEWEVVVMNANSQGVENVAVTLVAMVAALLEEAAITPVEEGTITPVEERAVTPVEIVDVAVTKGTEDVKTAP